ncbi:DUF6888 family protein [Nostoc sp.]|uniref:DUF6888 family protein n=1 Tax=Nostoc sp. TaxID=1180 RepID=UPI003FA59EA6
MNYCHLIYLKPRGQLEIPLVHHPILEDYLLAKHEIQTRDVYILAGENIQIIVPPSGLWRFLNETEL